MSLFAVEKTILLFVQSIRLPGLNEIMRFITTIGDMGIIWFVLIVVLFCFKKTRRAGFDMLLSLAVCWCFSNLLVKPIIARPRPFALIPELSVLVKLPADFSFPSGHACSSFACAYAGWRSFGCIDAYSFARQDDGTSCVAASGRGFWGKLGGWMWLLAALIAVSRVYVGVHYLTDILAGAAIGGFGSMGVYALNKRYIPESFMR